MSDFWPFVIAGLTTGSLYGLAAMGLVLTYKTSGIFNFAHGAIAAGAAYIFFELNTRNDISWPWAPSVSSPATPAPPERCVYRTRWCGSIWPGWRCSSRGPASCCS